MEDMIRGKTSLDRIIWTGELSAQFKHAQASLSDAKTITILTIEDQLIVVTDGSVSKSGIGAILYVFRNGV